MLPKSYCVRGLYIPEGACTSQVNGVAIAASQLQYGDLPHKNSAMVFSTFLSEPNY